MPECINDQELAELFVAYFTKKYWKHISFCGYSTLPTSEKFNTWDIQVCTYDADDSISNGHGDEIEALWTGSHTYYHP